MPYVDHAVIERINKICELFRTTSAHIWDVQRNLCDHATRLDHVETELRGLVRHMQDPDSNPVPAPVLDDYDLLAAEGYSKSADDNDFFDFGPDPEQDNSDLSLEPAPSGDTDFGADTDEYDDEPVPPIPDVLQDKPELEPEPVPMPALRPLPENTFAYVREGGMFDTMPKVYCKQCAVDVSDDVWMTLTPITVQEYQEKYFGYYRCWLCDNPLHEQYRAQLPLKSYRVYRRWVDTELVKVVARTSDEALHIAESTGVTVKTGDRKLDGVTLDYGFEGE